MSDTSHAAARIAVLAATTLLFAAAWRGDESNSSRPAVLLATSKRESGRTAADDRDGPVTDGLHRANPGRSGRNHLGSLLCHAVQTLAEAGSSPRPLFSGTPALLGRSTIAEIADHADPRTAATTAAGSAIQ